MRRPVAPSRVTGLVQHLDEYESLKRCPSVREGVKANWSQYLGNGAALFVVLGHLSIVADGGSAERQFGRDAELDP